ncbi:unnamed protein product [Gongylonema pulchrum]|uniref:F-box domain-containing protein n=1 Tax=Gongylonema pulchrum TaxID=637853 RepID=A0A183DEH1_9BILA|nr:unnamed protein product [Gongylonema pulchrum]
MVTIGRLPPEILLIILKNCDFRSLLLLRQISHEYKRLVAHELRNRERLDLAADYFSVYGSNWLSDNEQASHKIAFDKIIAFLGKHMSHLKEFSVRDCPVSLTLTGLIQVHFVIGAILCSCR